MLHYVSMARTKIALKFLGTTQFPLDVMIGYPRQYIRHVFSPGDANFDVTSIADVGELNRNDVIADLINPLRAGGALFSIVETPGSSDIPGSGISPADATFGIGQEFTMRVPLVSGGTTGTADDVTIFNANCPRKVRVLDAYVILSTAQGASSATLWTAAAGTGTQMSEPIATAANGLQRMAGTSMTATSTLALNGSLFLRRSDRNIVGELVVKMVHEA